MKTPSDDLKSVLAAWRIEPEFRPDFNREVWRKIAAGNALKRESFWQNLISLLYATPQLATVSALAIAIITLSLGSAHVAARNANARQWTMLEERYAQSIDPLTRSAMKE